MTCRPAVRCICLQPATTNGGQTGRRWRRKSAANVVKPHDGSRVGASPIQLKPFVSSLARGDSFCRMLPRVHRCSSVSSDLISTCCPWTHSVSCASVAFGSGAYLGTCWFQQADIGLGGGASAAAVSFDCRSIWGPPPPHPPALTS